MDTNRPSPRPALLLLVLAVITTTVLGLVSPASAAAPSCSTHWGSLAKGVGVVPPGAGVTLTGVRAGRHACFDRLVLDVHGPRTGPAWQVRYVRGLTADPTGDPVPLRGGADLAITAGVSDHTDQGVPTYRPGNRAELVPLGGYRTFRQVAWAGSFEGLTTLGLGVRARLPFRVLVLPTGSSGARLVIDVAHAW
jgi:hypothetical protein